MCTHVLGHGRHHSSDGGAHVVSIGRIDNTEHALLAMCGHTTVEEDRVGVIDDLRESERLVLDARCEGVLVRLVADFELGRVSDGVHVRVPHEFDRVADGCVGSEGNIAEDTLGRSDNDGVGRTRAGRS